MSKKLTIRFNLVLLALLIAALIFNRVEILMIVVGIIATIFVVIDAIKAVIKKEISVDLLAAIALFVSLIKLEWMSVVFINLMITSARIFGQYTEGVASGAIESLLKLRPERVKVKIGKEIKEIGLSEIKTGDLVVVETGDRIAIDGVVIEGAGSVDQSSLTGESIPVSKEKGDKVLSSTLNVSGTMFVNAEKVGKDTTFEKIIVLIEQAQMNKVQIQTLGQKFATWYVTLSLIGSVLIYLFTGNLTLVLSVLLVVCADDIAVAIPMAFWAAIGYAAKRGIIIKGTDILEGITKAKTLIVDKTGTLTKGKIRVTGVEAFDNNKADQLLLLVAEAESVSDHPIAKAIIEYAKNKGLEIKAPDKFQETPGKGVLVNKGKKKLVVGKLSFIKEQGIKVTKSQEIKINLFLEGGSNLVVVALGGKLLGLVTFEDTLKPGIKEELDELRQLGLQKIYMLTGDNEFIAKKVAYESGIIDYKSGLLPEQKLTFVKEHLKPDSKLIMVGDGINDAAALAQADIGIAMGAIGADSAIESADIALMNDDFSKIKETVSLGNYTMNIAKQNFIIWGVVNMVGLVLVFGGIIGPSGAALFNFVTDFIPIANSLRILRYKFFEGTHTA